MANHQARLDQVQEELQQQHSNERVVRALYEALNSLDVETVQRLLAPDVEWWFHGPPSHQHLMRLLTTGLTSQPFIFVPLTVAAFGASLVIVEGHSEECNVSWVHAWTVSSNGIITQVREYFNTSLTVARLGSPSVSSSPTVVVNCQSVWQSKLCDNKSMPGLVLAL